MSSAVPGPKTNYQGNSKTDREATQETPASPKGKLKPVSGVSVIKTKKSIGKRVAESFGGQDLKSVGTFLMFEVVIPSTRDLLFDLIKEGGHRAIYGDTPRRSAPSNTASTIIGSRIRQTNYQAASRGQVVQAQTLSSRERSMFDFSNLVIPDRGKAEEVVERMGDAVTEFGLVTVADFYDLLEISGTGFTDQTFGWDVNGYRAIEVKKVREGWVIDLPNPIALK